MAIASKILRIGQKVSRSKLEFGDIRILGGATDQTTVEFAVLELELPAHFPNRNRTFHGWNRRDEHVVLFAHQTIRGQALARHLLARWLDGTDHDRVGAQTFDLTLGLITDPLGNRKQPDNACHADEDA